MGSYLFDQPRPHGLVFERHLGRSLGPDVDDVQVSLALLQDENFTVGVGQLPVVLVVLPLQLVEHLNLGLTRALETDFKDQLSLTNFLAA